MGLFFRVLTERNFFPLSPQQRGSQTSFFSNKCIFHRIFVVAEGDFTAEPLCSLRLIDEPQKWRNRCLRLRPRSLLGVMLMSCKVNFHVVRSALQNSACLLRVYFCCRSYVLWHIGLRSFAV